MGANCCASEELPPDADSTSPRGSRTKPEPMNFMDEVVQQTATPAGTPMATPFKGYREGLATPIQAITPSRRGEEFTVEIYVDDGRRLGIDVDVTDGAAAVVDNINEGLVMDWNRAHPEAAIKKHDRIMEVNGQRGDANLIIETCKRDQRLVMKVLRVPRTT
eukprot:TRINITY_DN112575_c0_g1_i1.p1 TRINITY_DN112575_c0_g1~~TRINITY_DN112575_c0_g1_i1.p1  ORF type:complete len:177 (+),score=40.44 TRINITY_DN112575_c0_g1_i1:48-533(+)